MESLKKVLLVMFLVSSQFMFSFFIGSQLNFFGIQMPIFRTSEVPFMVPRPKMDAAYFSGQVTVTNRPKEKRFRPGKGMLFSEVFDNVTEVRTVQLLVICLTPANRPDRRDGVRKTWWKTCQTNPKVACWFMTDSLESITDEKVKNKVLKEQKAYKDLLFSPVKNGILFGYRFLYLTQWGMANYNFEYLLRIDDDILFCIDHLLWDLPNFPKENLHWGFLQCQAPRIVYIDEGMCMFSRDIIVKFLSQKPEAILCHPFGDQTITIWEQSIRLDRNTLFHPETRLHHHPPASYVKRFKTMNNICDNYIYLHGVYKSDMVDFWKRRGNGRYNKYVHKKPKELCPHEPFMDWRAFGGIYHQDPKPCINKPTWNLGFSSYPGREGR